MHYDSALGMFVDATGNAITYENWSGGSEPVVADPNDGCVNIDGDTPDFDWVALPNSCVSLVLASLCSLELK